MAPHNSTLIHEHEPPNAELKCYSPILPLRDADDEVSTQATDDGMDANEEEIPIWIRGEPRYVSGIKAFTTCNDIIEALINDEITNEKTHNDIAVLRDDYVICERWRDMEQVLSGNTEIVAIWKAWGAARNEVQFRLKINKNKGHIETTPKTSKHKKGKKEKVGVISKLVKRVMKQGELIQQHLAVINQKSSEKKHKLNYQKYIKHKYCKALVFENETSEFANNLNAKVKCKCCRNKKLAQAPAKVNNTSYKPQSEIKSSEDLFYSDAKRYQSTDEIMLILDHSSDRNISMNVDDTQSTVSIRDTIAHNNSFNLNLEKFNFDESTQPTPRFYKNDLQTFKTSELFLECTPYIDNDHDAKDGVRRLDINSFVPSFRRTSFRFEMVRKEISKKMTEMEQLLQQEINLLKKLQIETNNYKTEKQLNYFKPNTVTEIENTEHELMKTKSQLMQRSRSLEHLKNLLNDDPNGALQKSKSYEKFIDNNDKENESRVNLRKNCDKNDTFVI